MTEIRLLLRSAREQANCSLATLALRTHFTKSHLSNVENGRRAATVDVIHGYESALGVTILSPVVDLRHLLAGVGDVPSPDRIGMPDVDALDQATAAITALDLDCGGGLAAEMAKGQLRWAVGLLGATMTHPVRVRLSATIATLANRAGFTMFDTGDAASAARLSTLALRVGVDANDPDLRAQLLTDAASREVDTGNPGAGLRTADIDDCDLAPVSRFMLAGVRARAHAALGDVRATWKQIDVAEKAHAQVDTGDLPACVRPFADGHAAHSSRDAGNALYLLAQQGSRKARSEAIVRLTDAVNSFGHGRARAVVRSRVRLATLLAADGRVEEAREQAAVALCDGGGLRSARVGADLTRLRQAALHW